MDIGYTHMRGGPCYFVAISDPEISTHNAGEMRAYRQIQLCASISLDVVEGGGRGYEPTVTVLILMAKHYLLCFSLKS